MEKIKSFIDSPKGKNTLIAIIIILIGLGSFGLGRISAQKGSKTVNISYPALPVLNTPASALNSQIKQPTSTTNTTAKQNTTQKVINNNTNQDKNFLASKQGSKYYPVRCSAGKNIKLENRIYFKTEQEAITAGYTKSTSCK